MPDLATITDLKARPGVQQIELTATVDDPNANGLPYLAYKDVEFLCSEVNDRDDVSAEVIGTERLSVTHTGQPEEIIHYFWARPRFSYVDATGATIIYYGDYYPSSPTAGVSARAIGMSGLAFGMANGQLVATVDGDLLLEVTTKDDNAPSADNPIYLALPAFDTSIGGYEISSITTALSKVIGDGSTMGVATNDTAFRLWAVMMDDAGTSRLGLVNCARSGDTGLMPLDESQLVYMTNGASSDDGDSAGIIYGNADVGPLPFRILGSLTWEDGLPTAGHWDTEPFVQLFGRGSKKPGEVIHTYAFADPACLVSDEVQVNDDTIPTDEEGDTVSSIEYLGFSKANFLDIDVTVSLSVDVSGAVIASLCRAPFDGSPSLCAAIAYGIADQPFQMRLRTRVRSPGPDGAVYALRVGPVTALTEVTMNGIDGSRVLGGAMLTTFTFKEIAG